jgi:hypothetical protein
MNLEKLGPKVHSQGNNPESPVTDDEATSLMTKILIEMRKMNLHFAVLTDNHFDDEDIN